MKWFLVVITGVFCFLAMAPRGLFFLGWLAFLPLLWAQKDSSYKQAFCLAWLAGTIANIGNFYWVYELMVTHSALPAPIAVLGTVLLCAQQGIREALWIGLSRRFGYERVPAVLVYPTVYTAVEFLYPTIFPLHLSDTQANCL